MTWGAVGAAAVGVVGGMLTHHSSSANNKGYAQAAQKMDPYGPYRDQMAQKLNDLVSNPSSIQNTAEYKARMQAAQRVMAANGYTGSGNALIAAANAGGDAYQQAFNNLVTLSGANAAPGAGAMAAASGQAQNRQNTLNQYSGIANSLVYAGQKAYQNWNAGSIPAINTGQYGTPTVSDPVAGGVSVPDVSVNPTVVVPGGS